MTRLAVFGMGNLGRAAAEIIEACHDMELVAMFDLTNSHTVYDYVDAVDVLLVCVGSAKDAPMHTPQLAKHFNTVDTYDIHAQIGNYADAIRKNQGKGKTSVIATGWDPGLMSLARIYFSSVKFQTSGVKSFWGPGVSLGHTNAIKAVRGVQDAIQFTMPKYKRGIHVRLCYVVASGERTRIASEIKSMPNLFAPYKTRVRFISQKRFNKKFTNRREHAGRVVASDETSMLEFRLRTRSNPHLAASVMVAYAAACHKLNQEGQTGVFTVADIAPKYLTQHSMTYEYI